MSRSYACALAVVDALLAAGLTDLVLCPGSRSAPLALAAHRAALAGRLRLHVRIDERTAGFLALGLAKGSGRCVPVVTTSGTAVGNLLPAVMEASHARVPLLVISADRPRELIGTGANQTTWQPGIFAGFPRAEAAIEAAGDPLSWSEAPTELIRAAEAVLHAGPVHLNIALPEPLVPAAESTVPAADPSAGGWETGTLPVSQGAEAGSSSVAGGKSPVRVTGGFSPSPDRRRRLRWPSRRRREATGGAAEVVGAGWDREGVLALSAGPRTVVVCGDAAPAEGAAARAFAEAAGLPLIAEPSSGARLGPNVLRCGRLLLGTGRADQVERVVMFGHPTLSRPVNRLLTRADVELIVVGRGPLPNPANHACAFAATVQLEPDRSAWLAEWQAADRAASQRVDALVSGLDHVSGPAVAATVLAGGAGALVLGNSMAIRDADLAPVTGRRVLANRGLSGIDGTVSTAIGIALATGGPTTLLCGDLSFVHDANALAIGPGQPRPELRIVVADDAGGAIFATLEYGQQRFSDSFEAVFATPSGVAPAVLARGYGVPATRVDTLDQLATALEAPIDGLQVIVIGIDRAHRGELAAALAGCAR
ncbi:MAG: 2-succinyl-5-enolpyruvyl-6-hydroxy-3-cyclohexene-1-carboxylic-acid synthase [Actinobacteria bacterium]|nr:2-succinyl-5-enolpyruvyl-6-hydroxy-3-cyclohexene-1-carboxylic-acid synthase [Actinomycetota bacterium]